MALLLISFEVQGVKDGQRVDVGGDPKVFKSEHKAWTRWESIAPKQRKGGPHRSGSLSEGEGLMNKPTHFHNELEMGPLFSLLRQL